MLHTQKLRDYTSKRKNKNKNKRKNVQESQREQPKQIKRQLTPRPTHLESTTMATSTEPDPPPTSSSSSIFSQKNSRLPDDTVFYAIFPDFTLNPSAASTSLSSSLQSLHLQILQTLSPFTSDYLWQHEPFTLSVSSQPRNNF